MVPGRWPTTPRPIRSTASATRSARSSRRSPSILKKIQYGTVVLVVQDGKVVQIEMAEKFRLR